MRFALANCFKIMIFILLTISLIAFLPLPLVAQDTQMAPVRAPEQEATIQTERMQRELQLNSEQAQLIYEINLRHARERKVANSRTQAVERVRVKDQEIQQVLTREQYSRLQEMRQNRSTTIDPFGNRPISTQPRTRPVVSGSSAPPAVRVNPSNENVRRITPGNVSPGHRTGSNAAEPANEVNTRRAVAPAQVPERNAQPANNQNQRHSESPRGNNNNNNSQRR